MNATDIIGILSLAKYFQASPVVPVQFTLRWDGEEGGEAKYTALELYDCEEAAKHFQKLLGYTWMNAPAPRRVLDIGCGPGRFTLLFQDKGYDTVGIDISPGAIWTCKQRGVKEAHCADIWTPAEIDKFGRYDIILLLGNNLGIGGTPEGVKALMGIVRRCAKQDALMLVNSIDVTRIPDPSVQRVVEQKRARGQYVGQQRYRLQFGPYIGEWFNWVQMTPTDLADLAAPTGWSQVETYWDHENPGAWSGVWRAV